MFPLKSKKAPEFLPKAFCRPGTPSPTCLIYPIGPSACQLSLVDLDRRKRKTASAIILTVVSEIRQEMTEWQENVAEMMFQRQERS
jgi:hypothetical protein